jgi:hypothetical protein
MSDGTISLELIGTLLRQVQAEQRNLRDEIKLIRREMESDRAAVRDLMHEVLTVVTERVGSFEALMEARFDQQSAQINERIGNCEALMATRIDQQSAQINERIGNFEALMGTKFDQLVAELRSRRT